MLTAKECTRLTADDWKAIAQKIIRVREGETLLMSVSDEHTGGITSCMPEAGNVIQGFAAHANILLLNGDDFEYESPAAFLSTIEELKQKYAHLKGADYRSALVDEAEKILSQKVRDDIAALAKLAEENPDRQIIKVIGNHENFITFRDGLDALEKQYHNFSWTPEVAMIPIPGGKKSKSDRLLAVHGDLQMDDLWFVEDGGTDKERKCYTHRDMAEKAVSIATRMLTPSAQKQEKGQGIVNWWRKPNATAKTLYAELLYRAQEGDFFSAARRAEIDMEALELTERKLGKRRRKFEAFRQELEERADMPAEQRDAERQVYDRAIEEVEQRLQSLERKHGLLERKTEASFHHMVRNARAVLHYKKPGDETSELFTSKTLRRATHINYGHTHVPAEGVEINGMDGKKVTVSNNASVTGAVMKKPLDKKGQPRSLGKGEEAETDFGNFGMLLYRTQEGRIKEILSVGRLISENLHLVKQMVREASRRHEREQSIADDAISPEAILRRRAAGPHDNGYSGPS